MHRMQEWAVLINLHVLMVTYNGFGEAASVS
jgi:hypothetical protein